MKWLVSGVVGGVLGVFVGGMVGQAVGVAGLSPRAWAGDRFGVVVMMMDGATVGAVGGPVAGLTACYLYARHRGRRRAEAQPVADAGDVWPPPPAAP